MDPSSTHSEVKKPCNSVVIVRRIGLPLEINNDVRGARDIEVR